MMGYPLDMSLLPLDYAELSVAHIMQYSSSGSSQYCDSGRSNRRQSSAICAWQVLILPVSICCKIHACLHTDTQPSVAHWCTDVNSMLGFNG
jgi:hypothetical protein